MDIFADAPVEEQAVMLRMLTEIHRQARRQGKRTQAIPGPALPVGGLLDVPNGAAKEEAPW